MSMRHPFLYFAILTAYLISTSNLLNWMYSILSTYISLNKRTKLVSCLKSPNYPLKLSISLNNANLLFHSSIQPKVEIVSNAVQILISLFKTQTIRSTINCKILNCSYHGIIIQCMHYTITNQSSSEVY